MNVDVVNLGDSLGVAVRLTLYGLVGLGLCLISIWIPDAPMLAYLVSMSTMQFGGFRVGLMLMQLALVLFKTREPRLLVPSGPLLLFLLCLTASGSWALDPQDSFFEEYAGISSTLLEVPLTVAVISLLRSNLTTIHRLLWALTLGSIPGCIRTIGNALAGVRYLEGNQSGAEETGYYMGFIPPDIFSTILIMSGVFLMFCLTSSETSIRGRIGAALLLPVVCVGLLLSGIRSGWFVFGLATLLLLVRTRSALAIVGVLLGVVCCLSLSSAVGLNLHEKMSARMSEKSMHSGELRLQFWEVAAQGFAKRPILGIGWGCFPGFAADNTVGRKFATHNLFVRLACELGLVGLGVFCAWVLRTMLRLRGGSSTGALVRILMLAVLVQGLSLDHFVCSHFWFFLGACDAVPVDQPPRAEESLDIQQGLTATRGVPLQA